MLEALVNGLLLGGNYALLAIGYTLVFGVMRLLTLAHGHVFMAAGVIALATADALEVPFVVALGVAIGAGALLSMLTDVVSFRPVGYSRPIAAAVSTIGFAIVIENTVLQLRKAETALGTPESFPTWDFTVGSLVLSGAELAVLATAVLVMAATHLYVRSTRWGIAMRAFGHDPGTVALLGVPVRRLALLTLAIAGALAGLSAVLLAVRQGGVAPDNGLALGLIGLAAMVIGGLGSLPGAMVGGLSLGVAQKLLEYQGFTGWQEAIPWLLLLIVLLVRPQGLFGEGEP